MADLSIGINVDTSGIPQATSNLQKLLAQLKNRGKLQVQRQEPVTYRRQQLLGKLEIILIVNL